MGPTPIPTRTLGMRLSYSTRVHVYTRAFLTDNLARILARNARVGQVGEDPRACPARGKLNGDADFRASIPARKSARMSVSVSVSWNSSYTKLTTTLAKHA